MTIKYNEEIKLRLGIHYYIIECLTSSVRNIFCIIYCYFVLLLFNIISVYSR